MPTAWKILVGVLLAIILALAIALGVVASKNNSDSSTNASTSTAGQVKSCSSPYKQDATLPADPTVFQDLSPAEYNAVRDYLFKQTSLNLTQHAKATHSSNVIYLIELYLPNKNDVLNYLDKNGPKPTRRARVVITNGGRASPNVEEYLVSPLPTPNSHTRLRLAHRREPISFAARPFTGKEEEGLQKILKKVTSECYAILKESFGFWYGNCTTHCLRDYIDGTPANFRNGARKSWIVFLRDRHGYDILPVPFEVLVDHADVDVNKWKVEQVGSTAEYLHAHSLSQDL